MPKVHFTTQGCSSNLRESEIMMGLLENSGYGVSHDKNNADVNVINICTVKGRLFSYPMDAIREDLNWEMS